MPFPRQGWSQAVRTGHHDGGIYDDSMLRDAMGRAPGRRGARRLREALAVGAHLDPQRAPSVLEERFVELIRSARPALPRPRHNAWLPKPRRRRRDRCAVEEAERLAVELDSSRFALTPAHAHEIRLRTTRSSAWATACYTSRGKTSWDSLLFSCDGSGARWSKATRSSVQAECPRIREPADRAAVRRHAGAGLGLARMVETCC